MSWKEMHFFSYSQERTSNNSADSGRAEIHLAFHGPYTVAVLIGRHLTQLAVAYEWEGDADDGPKYRPTLVLDQGRAGCPVAEVLLEIDSKGT